MLTDPISPMETTPTPLPSPASSEPEETSGQKSALTTSSQPSKTKRGWYLLAGFPITVLAMGSWVEVAVVASVYAIVGGVFAVGKALH